MLDAPEGFVPATKVVSNEELIRELDDGLLESHRDRRQHPFVNAVAAGTATIDQIAGWRHQICHWAHPTNRRFGFIYSRCPDDDLTQMMFENMAEEEHGATSGAGGHIALNYRFLDELGWDEEKRAKDFPKLETWALRHWFEVVFTNRPVVESIGSLSFAAERLNPHVLGRVYQGLKEHYDISEEGLASLAVHASHVEEEHGSLGPLAFERHAQTVDGQNGVRAAVWHTAELYYSMYNVWQYY